MKKSLFFILCIYFVSFSELKITDIENLIEDFNILKESNINFEIEELEENKEWKLINYEEKIFIIVSEFWYTDLAKELREKNSSEFEEFYFKKLQKMAEDKNFKLLSSVEFSDYKETILTNNKGIFIIRFNKKDKKYFVLLTHIGNEHIEYYNFFRYIVEKTH